MPLPSRRLAALVCCAALAACSDPSAALPPRSPSPSAPAVPSPSPTPAPPAPVDGDVHLTATHLAPSGTLVYSPGSPANRPVEVDEPAVHAFVGAVDAWLDRHLTAVQAGTAPDLPPPLDPSTAPAAVAAVTTALTGPEAPVASTRYDVEVAVDGGPRWAHVAVTVTRRDGSTAAADLVFVPGPEGPVLVAAGPTGEGRP